jgi:hypothetical protein
MHIRVIGAVLVASATFASTARAQTPSPRPTVVDLQAAVGLKLLPHDPVAGLMFGDNGGFPQTSQLGLDIALVVQPRCWPVSPTLIFGYGRSSRNRGVSFEETVTTLDLGLGVRKTFDVGNVHPFVGAGFALGVVSINDQFTDGYETWRGAGSGGFAEAGAFIRVRSILDIGLTVRYSNFWSDWFPVRKARYWDAGGLFGGVIVGAAL